MKRNKSLMCVEKNGKKLRMNSTLVFFLHFFCISRKIPAGGRVVAVAKPEAGVSPLQQAHRDALVTVALEEVVRVLIARTKAQRRKKPPR